MPPSMPKTRTGSPSYPDCTAATGIPIAMAAALRTQAQKMSPYFRRVPGPRQGLQSRGHRPPQEILQRTQEHLSTRTAQSIPPYIAGSIQETIGHDHQVLCSNLQNVPDIAIAAVPDRQLIAHLCRMRASFPLLHTATGNHTVECIMPLRQVV